MQSFKPYLWLKSQSSRYNLYYSISIPANYDVVGLQTATENSTTGVRTYEFHVTATSHASQVVDASTGNHDPSSGITKVEIVVVDVTDPNQVIKGKQVVIYQDAETM